MMKLRNRKSKKKDLLKVNYKKENKLYAMKEMSKAKIIDKRSEKGIKDERDLLSKLYHPFKEILFVSIQR